MSAKLSVSSLNGFFVYVQFVALVLLPIAAYSEPLGLDVDENRSESPFTIGIDDSGAGGDIDGDPFGGDGSRGGRVFITSERFSPNLHDHLGGADLICQQVADSLWLGGQWVAWTSAGRRLAAEKVADTKYLRLDRRPVADDLEDLLDGELQNPITVNEFGGITTGVVYTGTSTEGAIDENCENWSDATNSSSVLVGNSEHQDSRWTQIERVGCGDIDLNGGAHLYCFEVEDNGLPKREDDYSPYRCEDSDGGRRPELQGTLSFFNPLMGADPLYEGRDTCIDERTLEEFRCEGARWEDDRPVNVSDFVSCAHGCVNGECLPPEPPIEVCTVENLNNIRNDLSANYIQVCDIDLRGVEFSPIGSTDGGRWYTSDPFTGRFDGNGHVIRNLYVTDREGERNFIGLFSFLENATIENLRLVGTHVQFSDDDWLSTKNISAGLLAGGANGSSIRNVTIGGIAEVNFLPNYGDRIKSIGGILGFAKDTGITSSEFAGWIVIDDVYNPNYWPVKLGFGGVVGVCSDCSLLDVRSSGSIIVQSSESSIGGLIGLNLSHTILRKSRSSMSLGVTKPYKYWGSGAALGGLVGRALSFYDRSELYISDSYFDGLLSAGDPNNGGMRSYVGGLVGFNWGLTYLWSSYSAATFDVTQSRGSDGRSGGLVAYGPWGNADRCYWDTELSDVHFSEGGEGKTTAEMKHRPTYRNWDFDSVWSITNGESYPLLQ